MQCGARAMRSIINISTKSSISTPPLDDNPQYQCQNHHQNKKTFNITEFNSIIQNELFCFIYKDKNVFSSIKNRKLTIIIHPQSTTNINKVPPQHNSSTHPTHQRCPSRTTTTSTPRLGVIHQSTR